jgi:hypothetical protein
MMAKKEAAQRMLWSPALYQSMATLLQRAPAKATGDGRALSGTLSGGS